MFTLAIETGGTKLQALLGTRDGKIVFRHQQKVVPSLGYRGTLDAIEQIHPEMCQKAAELGGSVDKIALGFGGIVDYFRGAPVVSEQIAGWEQFPLRDYLTEKTGVPAFVFNDTDSATWGEYVLGAGRGQNIFMYTNIGSGIGGGLVADDMLCVGQGFGAVEIGQTMAYDYESGEEMRFTRLERLCSGWGIETRLRRRHIPADSVLWRLCGGEQPALTCKMLGEAVKEGDLFAVEFFDKTVHVYSIALANAISLFAPEVVAIGGGVGQLGDILFSRVRKYVDVYAAKNVKGRYKIVACELGEEIVPIGALLLANNLDRANPAMKIKAKR